MSILPWQPHPIRDGGKWAKLNVDIELLETMKGPLHLRITRS